MDALYFDQYFVAKIVNNTECRKGFDISSLKCIMTAGNLLTLEFKRRVLELAPLSVVSITFT